MNDVRPVYTSIPTKLYDMLEKLKRVRRLSMYPDEYVDRRERI